MINSAVSIVEGVRSVEGVRRSPEQSRTPTNFGKDVVYRTHTYLTPQE